MMDNPDESCETLILSSNIPRNQTMRPPPGAYTYYTRMLYDMLPDTILLLLLLDAFDLPFRSRAAAAECGNGQSAK